MLSQIAGYQMGLNTDIKVICWLKVAKRPEIPSVRNSDVILIKRHCERSHAIAQSHRDRHATVVTGNDEQVGAWLIYEE